MGEVKVERRHREAAAESIVPSEHQSPQLRAWIERGVCEDMFGIFVEQARSLADFEQRGYQRCQADAIAHGQRVAAQCANDLVGGISGDTLRAFCNELRDRLHVGAGEEKP